MSWDFNVLIWVKCCEKENRQTISFLLKRISKCKQPNILFIFDMSKTSLKRQKLCCLLIGVNKCEKTHILLFCNKRK